MTDNINKIPDNENLDLEQLENVSGGLNCDKLALADSKLAMGDMKLGLASGLALGSASRLAAVQEMRLADNAALLRVGKKMSEDESL